MNRALKIGFLSVGGCYAALSLAGCKASACPDTQGPDGGTVTHDNCVQLQPTREYKDEIPRTSSAAWTTGLPISITNELGDITVFADSTAADQVQVSGVGFTRDTGDEAGAAAAAGRLMNNIANPTVTGDATGVVVKAPGGGFDGYHLTVHVPAAFDGTISVTQNTGEATLHSATAAKSSTVHTGVGDIHADNLTGTINISSGNGDLTVSATPSGPGNVLHTDLGDINTSLDGNLAITARAASGAVVFPAKWTMQTLAPDMASGSATIGDGSGALDATTDLGSIFFQ